MTFWRNRKIIFYTLAFLLLLGGISMHFAFSTQNSSNTVLMSASWKYNYSSIEEISADSELIALVKVMPDAEVILRDGLPFTNYNAVITDLIVGINGENIGDEIDIKMTGGELNGTIFEIADDPLLCSGDEILVFCRKNSDDTYTIISGPQGRLEYSNGTLNSLNVSNSRVKEFNPYSSIVVNDADYDLLKLEILEYTS